MTYSAFGIDHGEFSKMGLALPGYKPPQVSNGQAQSYLPPKKSTTSQTGTMRYNPKAKLDASQVQVRPMEPYARGDGLGGHQPFWYGRGAQGPGYKRNPNATQS